MGILEEMQLVTLVVCILVAVQAKDKIVERKFCGGMDTSVPEPINRYNSSERIMRLRDEMVKVNSVKGAPLDAYIITRYDAHQNEYVADKDKRLEYVTGFTGVYGLAVITKTKAAFWTDEAHLIQANNELSCNWTLFVSDTPGLLTPVDWLLQELKPGMRVGADPKLVPNTEWEILEKNLNTITIYPAVINLVDLIWTEDKSELPSGEVYLWPEEYSGRLWKDKVEKLRAEIQENYDAIVLTSLSEIAWLFNIRGSDVPYTPVVRAYAAVSKDQIHLFTNITRLSDSVKNHLNANSSCFGIYCVKLHEYEDMFQELKTLSKAWKRVLLPAKTGFNRGVNRAVFLLVWADRRRQKPSPLIDMMAEKSSIEREGMKKAQIREAVTFCLLMAYLKTEWLRNDKPWYELDVVNATAHFHSTDNEFRSLSYPMSVASGPHTGIPEYLPNNITNLQIEEEKLLIIDVGAQYIDGTTSIARTIRPDGRSSDEETLLYTKLLAAFINFASLTFPSDLTLDQLDVVCRTTLWDQQINSPHISGHGIGTFLDFHQYPTVLDYRIRTNSTLKEGYFIRSEVGFYQEESFGMKLASILEVVRKNESVDGYLTFSPVTLVPFETSMIDTKMLSPDQIMWLNNYNEMVKNITAHAVLDKSQTNHNAYNWIDNRTDPVSLPDSDDSSAISMFQSWQLLYLNLLPILYSIASQSTIV